MHKFFFCLMIWFACSQQSLYATIKIHVNQVAMNTVSYKAAIVESDEALPVNSLFTVTDSAGKVFYTGALGQEETIEDWLPGKFLYKANFTLFEHAGSFQITIKAKDSMYHSFSFMLMKDALPSMTLSSVIHYYNKQRANTPQEVAADKAVLLFGSDKKVNITGGWCDASGDISKYFSHLAYTNYMMPQQIPMVTWSMEETYEKMPSLSPAIKDSLLNETLWGADYILQSLSPEGYFYMTVFSYFNPDPTARRIVGLLANSVTTSDYQCAYREGAGMAIAALARIATWKKDGAHTSAEYLAAAERAFEHIEKNNLAYDDDHKENIIDDHCALMAAVELWKATGKEIYKAAARKRAANLVKRMSTAGYFTANDSGRPYWHAADAGLPIITLNNYLSIEKENIEREKVLKVIKSYAGYLLTVTNNRTNPFGYARQSFIIKGKVQDGFFIPHENESGWWWQGENARLSSLATAALISVNLVFNKPSDKKTADSLKAFAATQMAWILGCNPYDMCFMYGFGYNNVPHMASLFGHGSEKGGISNGITGNEKNADGSGIEFNTKAEGNEWRWTEQWLPHAAWYLQAITALSTYGDN